MKLRERIEGMPANTAEDVAAQERLLAEVDGKTARLKCAADLLLAVEFQPKGADRRSFHYSMAIRAGELLESATVEEFRAVAAKATGGRPTFHWPLEFPEVFHRRGGFDAVVGNPPFMGGQKITGFLSEPYREYLVHRLAGGRRGSADICAYFFIRGVDLLGKNGQLGSLATNTIAQGDTREVGLDQLLAGSCVIPRAVRSRPWPGSAALEVALVWVRKGKWASLFVLDDRPVNDITAFLTAPGTVTGSPQRLKANEGKSFIGSYVLGMGFVLPPDKALALTAKDPRNRDVLFPFLSGEDLNSRPDQSPSRWVINFFDWPLEKAQEYPDCFRIIEEKVKPERITNKRKERREKWWHYAEKCPALYKSIRGQLSVLAITLHTKYSSFGVVPATSVFSHGLSVLTDDSTGMFTVLSGDFFSAWNFERGSSLGHTLRFTPSDCFETFPFPKSLPGLEAVGERYDAHRRAVMLARQEGLTKTYNRFHDPDETAADIQALRNLHVELDHAVADAYGWADLPLDHDFGVTKQGLRFTIGELARQEVLARLLLLNHERYAEEVRQGLHERKKPARGRAKAGAGLFEEGG